MLIGLVTDIHNHAVELSQALTALQRHNVERLITLGDTCDAFARPDGATSVAQQLRAAGALGVWGNHDFALCQHPSERHHARYHPDVLDFLSGMEPRLVVEDCHFSHEGPAVDPHDVAQLWALDEASPNLETLVQRHLKATTQRIIFVGHHHRWWVGTPAGRVAWAGEQPLALVPGERYFVIVAPVCEGWAAVYDTTSGLLQPIRCARGNAD